MTFTPSSSFAGRALALAVFVGLCLASSVFAGSTGQVSTSGAEAQAEFEIAQRIEFASQFAPQAMERGTEALAVRDYEKAFTV